MFGVAFHAGAVAAGPVIDRVGEFARRAGEQGRHIAEHAGLRVLLRQDMVEVGALEIIEIACVRRVGV